MLIHEPRAMQAHPILAIMSQANGRSLAVRIMDGMYEIGHFGSSDFLHEYEQYPDVSVDCYGVCDSYQQLLDKCPELKNSERKFVVTFHRVSRAEEPASGGWRWHKWGDYIGDQKPTTEYIHDEPLIAEVFVYHIYEKI